jgi:hypothetical protein
MVAAWSYGVLSLYLLVGAAISHAAEVNSFPTLAENPLLDVAAPAAVAPSGPWRGELGFRLHHAGQEQLQGWGYERHGSGITSARTALYLEGDLPAGDVANARLSARLSHEAASADGPAFSEAQIEQAYLDFQSQGPWHVKVGRQLAPLGSSDYFQLLDVVNPRDERTMGLADLKESRLPVFATRIAFERERSGAEIIVKHEFRPNRYGRAQSDFDPFIALGGGDRVARREAPNLWSQPDLVLRGYTSRPWGDLHGLLARVHEATPLPVAFEPGGFVLAHQASTVFGVGGNYVVGDWLLKGELARRSVTRQLRADILNQLALDTPRISELRAQTDAMIGARYTGVPGFTVDTEWLTQRTAHHDALLADPRWRHVAMVNLEWAGLHDRLRLGVLLGRWWGGGKVLRASTSYDLDDRWQAGLGLIRYFGGDPSSPLFPYARNDRLTLTAKYSF